MSAGLARAKVLEIKVLHEATDLPIAYDAFTARLEELLGRFEPAVAERLLAEDPSAAAARIGAMAGEEGLMLFGTQDHGGLFALGGKARKAKRYHIGNPLIAFQMTQHDIRAGLYAPLTVLVYETGPEAVRVEFDRPSSLFGQFGNQTVTEVALGLDAKLRALIEKAACEPRSPLTS
jgi:uncharacterized protein (DUF302 family)